MTTKTVNLELGSTLIEHAKRNAEREGYSSCEAYLESLLKLTILSEIDADLTFDYEADLAESGALSEEEYSYIFERIY